MGVRSNGTWEPLHNFVWYSNFNPKTLTGGIELFRSFNLKTLDGTGGVFNVQQNVPTEDLPLELRTAMIQSGGLNVTTAPKVDKDDVITSAASQRPSLEMTQYPAVRINSI